MTPYQRYLEALTDRLLRGPSPENWAETRAAIADHLRDYLGGRAKVFNDEMALMLLVSFEQCAAKEVPELFTPMSRKRGESLVSAGLLSCIESAGSYIVFCQQYAALPSVDRSPVQTVATEYKVSRSTASRWKAQAKTYEGLTTEDALERYRLLAAVMRASAKQYPRLGGASANAVRQRSRRSAK